ncbi:hypothetical protein BDZ89DRAFT_1060306 [Hymenopellis radicata]|nr:hypothetical protein BDZ89DRAFT_1060306 [Hymenopellis radicata]
MVKAETLVVQKKRSAQISYTSTSSCLSYEGLGTGGHQITKALVRPEWQDPARLEGRLNVEIAVDPLTLRKPLPRLPTDSP